MLVLYDKQGIQVLMKVKLPISVTLFSFFTLLNKSPEPSNDYRTKSTIKSRIKFILIEF